MIINLLVDNPDSWIVGYAKILQNKLAVKHQVHFVNDAKNIVKGDITFLLGCEKIVKQKVLDKNKHNLVIHESLLPLGKGWSPLTWQILEGKNDIPITLFEAVAGVDSGDIYLQDYLHFDGSELNQDLKDAQGKKTIEMCLNYVANYQSLVARPQEGQETFYEKRTPSDSELDPDKALSEQFNLLRVVDNERYPAFFRLNGHKYFIKIFKDN